MTRSRVRVARLIYVVGLVAALATAINGVSDESPTEWVVGPAMAAAIWWIAAGIAIRVGVSPTDFFKWLRSLVQGARKAP